jgi:GTP-binding protein
VNTFLDEARIYVQAGNGGNGSMHFHREKYVPNGGPDGGDGGSGGDVILRADRGLNTLFTFKRRRRFVAESGQAGGQNRMRGKSSADLVVPVPIGTVVRDADTGELLADLVRDNQMLVVVRGGRGGLGNVHFKTSTNQAPGFAEKGEPGQSRWLDLELKVIAEVGIIGLPNAGKSTLLSVISAARPKIADYPFTTLSPNLGVVEVDEEYSFVAADIPGLIEGAHEGVGLGHEFLRHIERTLVLLHLVDGSAADPVSDFHQINRELELYEAGLTEKPEIVAVTKMDLPQAREHWEQVQRQFSEMGYPVFALSAPTREGVEDLIYATANLVREEAAKVEQEEAQEVEVITIKRPADAFDIERRRHTFYVTGETVERLAVMTDMENDEAVHRLQQRLKRMGLFGALERAGAREGSKVRIGETEFTWDTSYEPEVRPRKR